MRLVVRLVVRLHYAHARLIDVRPGLKVPRAGTGQETWH